MEQLSPKEEYFRLHADISRENAETLTRVMHLNPLPLNEHVRRAISIYDFAFKEYEEGGMLLGVTEFGYETIPLMAPAEAQDHAAPRVPMDVNVNSECAQVIRKFGVQDGESETAVLDNMIYHYGHLQTLKYTGKKLVVRKATGETHELMIT